jgi:tetratricopeptide (TPR) repeat protein
MQLDFVTKLSNLILNQYIAGIIKVVYSIASIANTKAWQNKCADLYDQEKYDEAIQTYNQVIEINPSCAEAWYGKGIALSGLKKYDEAMKAYNLAIERNPQYAEAWYKKGIILEAQGKHDEAGQAFDKAIEINPKFAYSYTLLFSDHNTHPSSDSNTLQLSDHNTQMCAGNTG